VIHNFKGKSENEETALQAVNDSQEKYCGVSNMLQKALPITWQVSYNDNRIFSNKAE